MLNRSASLAISTSVLKALPGKLDIKRHSPSILYILEIQIDHTTAERETREYNQERSQYRNHICFSCIDICRARGSCLDTRPLGQVFKHRPRDPTSFNAMK